MIANCFGDRLDVRQDYGTTLVAGRNRCPEPSTFGRSSGQSDLPHILFIVDQFSKTLGGGERAVLQLASHLPEHGFQASILTFLLDPESPALKMTRAPIYLLPLHRTYGIEGLQAALRLRQFIRREGVVIVQTVFESSDLWAGFVTRAITGAKVVWSRRDMGILRKLKHRIAYHLMARIPHAVMAVSEEVRQYCVQIDGINSARVHTIYNGLNIERFANTRNRSRGRQLIISVGNIRRVKGHDIFIRAAAIVAQRFPRARFSIAGEVLEPQYFQELLMLIDSLGLADRFHFEGGVTDLPTFLAEAEIFVLPSRSEGFSNALIEAMAASLPVVATRVGGNPEAVEDGVTGLLVPPEDPVALADALQELLSDSDRSWGMGEAGRRLAIREFSNDRVVNQVVDIYHRLLSTP
jgi:glycosyltransferase involved in cell wall biosynthesis